MLKFDKNQKENWDNVLIGQELIPMIIKAKSSKEIIKYLEQRQKVQPIIFEQIRYKNEKYEVIIDDERINTQMWSPVLFAIASPNKLVELVKYMIDSIGLHTGTSLKEPFYYTEFDGIVLKNDLTDPGKFWNSILALQLAVQNTDTQMLDYLWNELYYLWDIADLDALIDTLYNHDFLDALSIILKGRAFRQIILSLSFEEQVFYLEKILFDKFDQDTQMSISSFIDDALATNYHFGTQYLYLNLKREYLLKDLLDVCLHNSNHFMIYQNADLFNWVFENMDAQVRQQDLRVMEALINNIIKGSKQVIELKFVHEELLRATRAGDLKKIDRLVEHGKITEVCQIKDREGIVLSNFEELQDMLSVCFLPNRSIISANTNNSHNDEDILKEWNPLHIAIFFNQIKAVRYYCENMKINVQSAIKTPGLRKKKTSNMFNSQQKQQDLTYSPLYFLMECFKYNLRANKDQPDEILRYFWEHQGYLFGEVDLKYLIENLFKLQKEELLSTYMYIPTTVYIIKGLPFEKRLIYLKELQYIGYQVNNIQKGLVNVNSSQCMSPFSARNLHTQNNNNHNHNNNFSTSIMNKSSSIKQLLYKQNIDDIQVNNGPLQSDVRSNSSSPERRYSRSIRKSDLVNRTYFEDNIQINTSNNSIVIPRRRSIVDSVLKQNQNDGNMQLITELLSERPYSLYCLLLCLDRGNTQFFKYSYQRINAQDIEELIRCSRDRAINIVRLTKSSRDKEKINSIQRDIQNYKDIEEEIIQLANRIENSPLIQIKMRQRPNSKLDYSKASQL